MTEQELRNAFRVWNLIAGLVIGLAAILSLPLIFGDLGGERGFFNWFTIFIGAFLTGLFFWWLLIGRTRRPTIMRGSLAGALSAILAYPFVFLLSELLLREVSSAIGLSTLPDRLLHALTTSLLALIFGGWFTILIGILVGGVLAGLQRRLLPVVGDEMSDLVEAGADRVSDFRQDRPVLFVLGGVVLVLVLVILVIGSWVWFAPLATGGLVSRPGPALDYDGAIAAYEAIVAAEDQLLLNPNCRSSLSTHGAQTEKVVVYLHGYTACPYQFRELGQEFFDQGYNVFVPRMPHHGFSDRVTEVQAELTAEELVAYADEAVDIAQGLGEEVIVIGLSGGASAAGWLAQERADVDQAIVIAPMYGILSIPPFAVKPVTTAALTIPNIFVWWDPATKEAMPGTENSYPRFSTRAIGQLLRLGRHVQDAATDTPPVAGRVVAVTNPADHAVNNAVFDDIVERWRTSGYPVETYVFPAELSLPHDVIEPGHPQARTEVVYPLLIDLANGAPAN
jgi:esterase/lipase